MSYSIVPVPMSEPRSIALPWWIAQRRLAEVGREADVAAVELPVRGVERGGDESGVGAAGAGWRQRRGRRERA